MHPSDTRNEKSLEQQLAQTLDRSLDEIDSATQQQLHNARLLALKKSEKHSTEAAAIIAKTNRNLAIAASVLLMLSIPVLLQLSTHSGDKEPDVAYLSVDPELLMTMDMLEILGTPDDAG